MEFFESLRLNSPIVACVGSFTPDLGTQRLKGGASGVIERRGEENVGSSDKEFTKRGEVTSGGSDVFFFCFFFFPSLY